MPGWGSSWDFEDPAEGQAGEVLPDDPFAAPGEPPGLNASRVPEPAAPVEHVPAAAAPLLAGAGRKPLICRSGLCCWRGQVDDPAALVTALSAIARPLLIARPDTLPPAPVPPEAEGTESVPPVEIPADRPPVFNWIPAAAARVASPALYEAESPAAAGAILASCWGTDGAVVMLTGLEFPQALLHLRAAVRGDAGTSTEPPAGVLMFYTPAGARSVLADAPAEVVAPLMQGVTAMLMEAENPAEWLLFSTRPHVARLAPVLG